MLYSFLRVGLVGGDLGCDAAQIAKTAIAANLDAHIGPVQLWRRLPLGLETMVRRTPSFDLVGLYSKYCSLRRHRGAMRCPVSTLN